MTSKTRYDLAVIGGGINGTGIAADAAGRGLSVLLAEMDDLASATSSRSSKLIHGGLRYLEHYEFGLVREALAEREVLLAKAPHIIWPLRFILPRTPGARPAWMLRAGLFLYDHLYRRRAIPASRAVDLAADAAGRPLQDGLTSGFAYWDCWVDDARLVVLNARAAADRGGEILTRTRMTAARAEGETWIVRLEAGNHVREISARALVNAAGPFVDRVAGAIGARAATGEPPAIRLLKGSHIVVPRIAGAEDAYLLQNIDGRVVFALPYEERFTLIGTTEVPFDGDPATAAASEEEAVYLQDVAARYFKAPIRRGDIIWSYAGVRPLYDDQAESNTPITRDWRLVLDAPAGAPPLLTVLGGKVTTYRRLAEAALERLRPYLSTMGPAWTAGTPLPGGDLPEASFDLFSRTLRRRHPGLDPALLRRLARRHGSLAEAVIGEAREVADLGGDLGHGLTPAEVRYMRRHEWAREADDVLWRRSKTGLHLAPDQRAAARRAIEAILAE